MARDVAFCHPAVKAEEVALALDQALVHALAPVLAHDLAPLLAPDPAPAPGQGHAPNLDHAHAQGQSLDPDPGQGQGQDPGPNPDPAPGLGQDLGPSLGRGPGLVLPDRGAARPSLVVDPRGLGAGLHGRVEGLRDQAPPRPSQGLTVSDDRYEHCDRTTLLKFLCGDKRHYEEERNCF